VLLSCSACWKLWMPHPTDRTLLRTCMRGWKVYCWALELSASSLFSSSRSSLIRDPPLFRLAVVRKQAHVQ